SRCPPQPRSPPPPHPARSPPQRPPSHLPRQLSHPPAPSASSTSATTASRSPPAAVQGRRLSLSPPTTRPPAPLRRASAPKPTTPSTTHLGPPASTRSRLEVAGVADHSNIAWTDSSWP